MANSIDFNAVSESYAKDSLVQKGASELLFSLLEIKQYEAVLDAGCGPGNLTRKIRELTNSKVTGIDASPEMIKTAGKDLAGFDIDFYNLNAEDMDFENEFDVVFCNSAFQWFTDPDKAAANFYKALKPGGRAGIQAPGGGRYCENFLNAIEKVKNDSRTKDTFAGWNNPFYMPEKASDYSQIFINAGFNIAYSEIITQKTVHTANEAFNIFSSGAIAGYLNKEYYKNEISDDYIKSFKEIVRKDFDDQCGKDGMIELIFRRIYLTGIK